MLPYINYPFEKLASATGSNPDELKLIISFLLSYPLAGLLKRIPDSKPEQKNLFSIAVSLFYLVGLFDLWSGIRTLFISAAGAYVIAWKIDGGFMPWIAFVFLMGHMSVGHIYRQFVNPPDVVDITGAQMVLVMKLTAFCWNIRDGQMPDSELADFQKERRLKKLPSLLDYAGYVLFFPSLFAGPSFDFVDYQNWLSTSIFEAPPGIHPASLPPTRKKRRIPRSGFPATLKALQGLVWIFLFLQFSGKYPSSFLLGPDYMRYSLLRRVWQLHVFGFTTRLKYYGVWSLTEGACILSGLGFSGIDPKTGRYNWSRLQNIAPIPLETAQNTRGYLESWNQNTNHWLKNYVYLRVTPKGKKPGFYASLATFTTSAFWHGFYPGYYLAFILASLLQTVAKHFRRQIRPFFLRPGSDVPIQPAKRFYDFASYLVTQLAFSFTVSAFILLNLHDCLLVWTRVYWYCPLGLALSMAFFETPFIRKELSKRLKAHNAAARPGVTRTISVESTGGTLGVPHDPQKFVDDAVLEARAQVEEARLQMEGVKRRNTKNVPLGDTKS